MSRVLLDTHTFFWFVADDPRLHSQVKIMLEEDDCDLFLSAISAFEIAIKHDLGKLPLDVSLEELLVGQLEANRIELLPIRPTHLLVHASLPFPANGHRDPFDRLLVSQARAEAMVLATGNAALNEYGVPTLW